MKRACLSIFAAFSLLANMQPAVFCQSARPALPATEARRLNEPASNNRAAQTASPADPVVEKIRRAVEKTGMAQKITVFLKNGDALHGAVSMIDRDEFAIAEVDFQRIFIIQYKDVKKIRSGYGGINLLTGKRASPPKGARIAVTAGLLFLIIGLPVIALATAED
jgi:hypothetical protein